MALRYDIVYSFAAAAAAPVLGYRMLRTGKWRTDWPGRFGHGPALHNGRASDHEGESRPTLLIHAVSVGEVNAIRQLVDRLAAATPPPPPPPPRLVISTTTDTGQSRARELFGERHPVVRYPLDFTRCVRRFLDRVRPDAVALTELEVWPNFVRECRRRDIPVCVINGRLSARSFSRYRRVVPLIRPTFAGLAAAAVQTPAYAQRFEALGTPRERIHVLDTMKWDTARIVDDGATVDGAEALARAMGIDPRRPVVVAGSTGEGEEQLLIDQRAHWPEGTQLVLVPRKPERFESVARLAPGIVRRSEHPDTPDAPPPTPPTAPSPADARPIFLLDTMGELGKAYALADVAIVGRSFNGWGGSDPIEPVAMGKASVVGPDHANFEDVVTALREAGGLRVVDAPGPAVAELLADADAAARLADAGRAAIRQRQGATERHVQMLTQIMRRQTT